jgi:hypothetical protein
VLRRWARWIMVIGAAAAAAVGVAGWSVYDRTGPRDAAAAGEQLRADMQTLASELGLRQVTPEAPRHRNVGQERCARDHPVAGTRGRYGADQREGPLPPGRVTTP